MIESSVSAVQGDFPVWQGGVLGEGGCSALELDQVRGQVAGGPAVAGPEGLGPGGLGVRHDPEPVLVGVEGDSPVVPDPGLLPAAGEVDVPGREAQQAGIGVDRILPLNGAAAECRGPGVEAPGYPDADPVGSAPALPPPLTVVPVSGFMLVWMSAIFPYIAYRLRFREGTVAVPSGWSSV